MESAGHLFCPRITMLLDTLLLVQLVVAEDDGAGQAVSTLEVRTEGLQRSGIACSRHLVVRVAISIQRVSVRTSSKRLVQIAGLEGITIIRYACRLIITHADFDRLILGGSRRGEGDGLRSDDLTVDLVCLQGRDSFELTTEVELVIALTRESDDVRHGSSQTRIILMRATSLVVVVIIVILLVLITVLVTVVVI